MTLLEPLDDDQRSLIDAVAEGFQMNEYKWPIWDFVAWSVERRGKDAWEIFESLPSVGREQYGPVIWSRSGSHRPLDEDEIKLSVIGFWRSTQLNRECDLFLFLLRMLVETRAIARPEPDTPRRATLKSYEFLREWRATRHSGTPHPRLTWELLNQEPRISYGVGYQTDDSWERVVTAAASQFAGVTTIEAYAAKQEELLALPTVELPPLIPSPLSLAAAIDYLDAVWQLTHDRRRLFTLTGAERITRLAFDVQTADEFASHLSALTDLLRRANRQAEADPPRQIRDRPLARLEADIVGRGGAEAEPRVREAIRVLELVAALRDAGQHGEAAARGVAAYADLGLGFPPRDWQAAWQSISSQTVSALNALREELAQIDA